MLTRIRNAARILLTLPEKDPKRFIQGKAILRRMARYALLDENKLQLDYVLDLTTQDILERRLQTLVLKRRLAKSILQARVLIPQKHILVNKQIVNVPSFMVRADSEKHINYAPNSPFGYGRPGRMKRKRILKKNVI